MQSTKDIIKHWSITGAIALFLLGCIIHFIYPLTGGSKIAGAIFPVNESVWEHLKLGYWALLLFSAFEYLKIKDRVNNYFSAKLLGIVALELTILIVFYSYYFFTGSNIIWIDISSYALGALLCQLTIYKVVRGRPVSRAVNRISLVGFICLGILFGVITFHPPHQDLFKEKKSNTYGINREN
jgi:hypothetical protein